MLAAGLIPLAVTGSVCIGVVLLVFVNKKSWADPYILVLRCDGGESAQAAQSFLEGRTRRCVLKSKTVRPGEVELNLVDGVDLSGGEELRLVAQGGGGRLQSQGLALDE